MNNLYEYSLLKNAIEYNKMGDVYVDEVFIKRDNVLYNGFWDKNGYNNIEVVFKLNNQYYKTPRYCTDVLQINITDTDKMIGIDCPHNCTYMRLFNWSNKYHFKLELGCSAIGITLIKKDNKNEEVNINE